MRVVRSASESEVARSAHWGGRHAGRAPQRSSLRARRRPWTSVRRTPPRRPGFWAAPSRTGGFRVARQVPNGRTAPSC